jgi:serine/threonine protein kinase
MASKLSAGSKLGTPEWTAPEVLQSSTNSEAGDVYSYGVVLWELFTGQIPWEEISAMQVVLMVGFHQARLTIPEDAPTWAREMMESCFRAAEARPSFSDIISRLRCQSGEGI